MREIEGFVGAALLQRHSRGIRLTEAGELFRRRAEALLQQIALVPAEVKATADQPSGALSVGFPPSMIGIVTAPAVAEFRARYPAVRLEVHEATSIQIRDALLSRDIDLGILSLPLAESELALSPLMTEPMVLVSPQPLPFESGRDVGIAEIAPLPLVLAKRPNSARIIVEHALQEAGFGLHLAMETDAAPIIEFVRHGIGYAILPQCYLLGRSIPGVEVATISNLRISWAIGVVKKRQSSVASMKMMEIIRSKVEAYSGKDDSHARYLMPPHEQKDGLSTDASS